MTTVEAALVEFLLARIAEDEAVARAASPGPWHTSAEGDVVLAVDDIEVCDGFALSGPQLRATTKHIALHDPARVLRRCEADRRIVEDCAEMLGYTEKSSAPILATAILKKLAAVYADHPDYREEWKP